MPSQMINTNFDAGTPVHLDEIMRVMTSKNMEYTYNKEQHVALNFKFAVTSGEVVAKPRNKAKKTEVTVLIFTSGKVIMTGGKHPNHAMAAFKFVTGLLDGDYDDFAYPDYVIRKRGQAGAAATRKIRKADLSSFYDEWPCAF